MLMDSLTRDAREVRCVTRKVKMRKGLTSRPAQQIEKSNSRNVVSHTHTALTQIEKVRNGLFPAERRMETFVVKDE